MIWLDVFKKERKKERMKGKKKIAISRNTENNTRKKQGSELILLNIHNVYHQLINIHHIYLSAD